MAAKKPAQLRIHQLAKELGVDSKVIIAKCQAEEIPGIKDHLSPVSAGLAATIREWFGEGGSEHTAVQTAAEVDVAKARAKARKRPSKKKAASGDEEDEDGGGAATAVAAPPEEETKPATPKVSPKSSVSRPPRAKAPARAIKPDVEDDFDAADVDHSAADTPDMVPAIAAKAPSAAPSKPAAPAPPKVPSAPPPRINVPQRPAVVAPLGPMLSKPAETKMVGPRIVRVEKPDVIAPPKPRGPRAPGPISRGGPRSGSGVGIGPADAPDGGRSGRDRGSRRSPRRGEEEAGAGRTGRLSHAYADEHVDWRQQDLLERENRLKHATGFIRQARRDNIKRSAGAGHRAAVPALVGGKVKVKTPISVKDLAEVTGVKLNDILTKLLMAKKPATRNSVLDATTASEVMLEYGIELETDEQLTAEAKIAEQFKERTITDERRRNPVVTILGHVDHGKTSLLDKIRNANVAAGEAGGITQATSAFQVPVHVGDAEHLITFIDTPGHEAFTEMRARGAKVTDVVVLVVAADDGVMPQTIESINHAKAAGVPLVVALNKIDKPEATDSNIQRILGQLAAHELNPVEWGGTTEVIRTSATKGTGIQDLLEILDYQAQLLELKADFGGEAVGTVLEASVAEGRGAVARAIVQQGTLKKGDFVVVGRAFGRVRDIVNDRGQRLDEATPSMPIAFSGINDVPDAGDKFYVVESLQQAEAAALERQNIEREQSLAKEKITLANVFKHLEATGKKELSLVVKADVQGSVETIKTVLSKISTDQINVEIKHSAVGGINESDVSLAEASNAIIVGFNVTASSSARKAAETRGVDIRFYDVIYDLTDDVKSAAEGLLEPEVKLEVLGHAEVRAVFKISRVGMVAGCYVTDGVIERNSQIRVTRDGIVIEKDRRLKELKRFKDDVKDVRAGQECGMSIDGYNDIKEGDVLECYKTREVKRKL